MYYASIGIYSLMGVDAAPQAFVPVADADVEGSVAKKPAGKATVAQTYFTLMKSFVGIGILALPHAFMQAGYMAATVGILVIGGVTYFCMALLIKSKQRVQERHGMWAWLPHVHAAADRGITMCCRWHRDVWPHRARGWG
mgnify:FL=1